MRVASTSSFRKNMKKYVDQVHNDHIPLILTRSDDVNVVISSLDDYNSRAETDYLNRSPENRRRLAQSIKEINEGKVIKKTLEELRAYE